MIPPPRRRHPAALRLATLAATHTTATATATATATPRLLQDSPGRRYPGMELYVPGQITTCENNYSDTVCGGSTACGGSTPIHCLCNTGAVDHHAELEIIKILIKTC